MTLTGLLSDRLEDGILESTERTRKELGNKTPTALPPADFTYSSIMLTAEFVASTTIFVTWSIYSEFGQALIAQNKESVAMNPDADIYDIDQVDVPIAEAGIRLVFKIFSNFRFNVGYGYRKDLGKKNGRRTNFESLDAGAFTNAFYFIMN